MSAMLKFRSAMTAVAARVAAQPRAAQAASAPARFTLLKSAGAFVAATAAYGFSQAALAEVNNTSATIATTANTSISTGITGVKPQDPLWRSQQHQKVLPHHSRNGDSDDLVLFSGNANPALARDVANSLGTKISAATVGRFADGEVNIQVHEHIRGKDVYILQPTCPPVNENLVELLLMLSTVRRASARRITAVIPYYGYARQDRKMSSRVPISAADVARLMETMGVDRVIAVDLHCGQIQGFFGPRVPVDNLEAQIIGLRYFVKEKNLEDPVVVSPDAGGVYRARQFQQGLIKEGLKEVSIAMIIKQRAKASVVERMDLVGNVENQDVIIVDDMIDTAGTLVQAAKELKAKGAKRVFAYATHGLFSGAAYERIANSTLEEVVVSDTVPLKAGAPDKIKQLSCATLLAEAIRRVHQKESVSALFTK